MPALLRYFSDLIHFKTSKLNPIPLHGNPILDNFVFKHAAVQTGRTFASAHSCGLRLICARVVDNAAHFATAHSCGLRPASAAAAFARLVFATAHSRGLRRHESSAFAAISSLPQRIRAGCDETMQKTLDDSPLCLSAFVRVATAEKQCSALRICCEKVDSFSSVGESGLALTIFPFSFAAKATYVAINDSFGRAIDRFFGANRTGISISYDFAEHPCL